MKKLMFLLFTVFSVSLSTGQTKVGDATLPNTETFDQTTLKLNGAGVREKFWIDLYAAGLYLNEKSSDAKSMVRYLSLGRNSITGTWFFSLGT